MEKINITFNRVDGSEMAKFDNIDDAILFAKNKWEQKSDSCQCSSGRCMYCNKLFEK